MEKPIFYIHVYVCMSGGARCFCCCFSFLLFVDKQERHIIHRRHAYRLMSRSDIKNNSNTTHQCPSSYKKLHHIQFARNCECDDKFVNCKLGSQRERRMKQKQATTKTHRPTVNKYLCAENKRQCTSLFQRWIKNDLMRPLILQDLDEK